MPPIPADEMGDVWPEVQPGSGAGDYGAARLEGAGPVEVRSFQTVRLIHEVGHFGLDDTGGIRVSFRWVNDCGPFQTSDPGAMNYVTARASNGAPLTLFVEPYGYRPWSLALRITVDGGFMRPGDTIEITLGDQSGGGPGWRMQTIAEAAFEMKLSVDACATGQFNPLSDALHFPVVAGPVARWALVAPGQRRPGEAFALGLRAEDFWGNPTAPDPQVLSLSADAPVAGLPETLAFTGAEKALTLEGLSAAGEGTLTFRVSDQTGRELAASNPLVIRAGDLAGYWGDLHGQSGETVGIGTIEEYFDFARDMAFLDVTGHQANDFQLTNAFWEKINDQTAVRNQDGRFILFPGYEWSGNTPVGGDHNVFFRREGCQIRRSSHAMLPDRSDLATDATTLDALFTDLAGEDCLLWSHIGGRPADVAYAHDPRLKTAVELHSNWGTFEWVLTDSLALGHRVGVVANSDGHKGRPGAGPPGATEFGAYGGLTCFLAPELTRDALFEAMRRRHHYATTGSRLALDVRAVFPEPQRVFARDPRHFDVSPAMSDHAIMGDIVETGRASVSLDVEVMAAAPIERLDILRGAELVATRRPYAAEDLGNRVRVLWQGAEYRGRGRNSHWQGEIRTTGASVTAMTPVNQWNPERPIVQTAPDRVRFEAVTSGNFAGVDLRLDGAGRLGIETNRVSGQIDLAELGLEDAVLDAGGLERQIRVRRLPERPEQCHVQERVEVALSGQGDSPVWVRVTTLDGHQAWSSPIYLCRAD